MSSGTDFSLYGIFFYSDDSELAKFKTYLSQINNSPIYGFKTEEKTYRTFFPEKFDLWNREVRLIQNLYDKPQPDFYKDRSWIVKFYESTALAARADVNARTVVESTCEDESVVFWILGLGFKPWESVQREGYAFRSEGGIETFVYELSLDVNGKKEPYKLQTTELNTKFLMVEAVKRHVDTRSEAKQNLEQRLKMEIEELLTYAGKISR